MRTTILRIAIVTLVEFYGISTDLTSEKNNNWLLCEIAVHENFQRLMTDNEISVEWIQDMDVLTHSALQILPPFNFALLE